MAEANAHYYAHARSARRGRRFHHRARDQPDVRRADRPLAGRSLAARRRAGRCLLCRARARAAARSPPTRCGRWRAAGLDAAGRISSRPARCCARRRPSGVPDATWHDDLATLPDDGPLLVVANEFFDALPIRQLVADRRGLARAAGRPCDEARFVPGRRPARSRRRSLRAEPGTIVETSPASLADRPRSCRAASPRRAARR